MSVDVSAGQPYPLRFDVEYPEQLSRWKTLVKWLLAFPHYLILYALGILLQVITFIAFSPSSSRNVTLRGCSIWR
ncbi:MAG TPA: hypothetical protein VNL15_07405 [Dehalococcoidia bacterium]|nr:hypothetical protein [Dehalococcoidia bacterium]